MPTSVPIEPVLQLLQENTHCPPILDGDFQFSLLRISENARVRIVRSMRVGKKAKGWIAGGSWKKTITFGEFFKPLFDHKRIESGSLGLLLSLTEGGKM